MRALRIVPRSGERSCLPACMHACMHAPVPHRHRPAFSMRTATAHCGASTERQCTGAGMPESGAPVALCAVPASGAAVMARPAGIGVGMGRADYAAARALAAMRCATMQLCVAHAPSHHLVWVHALGHGRCTQPGLCTALHSVAPGCRHEGPNRLAARCTHPPILPPPIHPQRTAFDIGAQSD